MATTFGRTPRVTVVSGPPCAGKSTYVAAHAEPGDVIVDLDRLALALSAGTDDHAYPEHVRHVAIGARRGAIGRALLVTEAAVWIIDTDPDYRAEAEYRQAGVTLVTVDPGEDVCLARAAELRPQMAGVIRAWYSTRQVAA